MERESWRYVAHEQDIPQPGDFKSLLLGREPVLVVRGDDGCVRVLFNTCRHRPVTVCYQASGNAKRFVCNFHGWVYNTKGHLIGLRDSSPEGWQFSERRGLTPLPRVAIYQGHIFASLSPEGEPLEEHIKKIKFPIDASATQNS
jgi:phenylpropionate dioxygenase-like ring-hydroxylating dioxygenase large terminal subunit